MNEAIIELEQQDIELQLMEIQLKRKQLELEREKLNKKEEKSSKTDEKMVFNNLNYSVDRKSALHLHYTKYVKNNPIRIADVCPNGSILISHGRDSCTVSKKYSMKTLSWIKQNLPYWVTLQREGSYFWEKLADKYSKKFLPNGESISRTTMKKLCYLVDSGKADVWFEKYNDLKGKGKQVTLDDRVRL